MKRISIILCASVLAFLFSSIAYSEAACVLDSKFQKNSLSVGMKYYTDRDYKITSVPSTYIGMEMIQTPNNDLNLTISADYLTFEMPSDGMVYVAYDSRATSEPNWMNGFIDTGDVILTSLASQPSLKIYSKSYNAGDCVNFGGNLAAGSSSEYRSNYIVFYSLSGQPQACVLNPKFGGATLGVGVKYYTDRDYKLTVVPSAYQGMPTIPTPNDDQHQTLSTGYLTFTMPYDGTVYVAYDSRATSLPNWLRSFTYTGKNIETSLVTQPYLKIYSKTFSENDCVNLGGNKAEGFTGNTISNYIVFFYWESTQTCVLNSRFQKNSLSVGMKYYTDRDYKITSVPSTYIGMEMIQTPNNDLNLTISADYLTFEMPSDGTVYVAYDSRATSEPNWMNGFIDTGDVILTSLATQPSLKIYSKSYNAGDCINFGANKAPGFSGNTVSNYIVFYGKGSVIPVNCTLDTKVWKNHDVYRSILLH